MIFGDRAPGSKVSGVLRFGMLRAVKATALALLLGIAPQGALMQGAGIAAAQTAAQAPLTDSQLQGGAQATAAAAQTLTEANRAAGPVQTANGAQASTANVAPGAEAGGYTPMRPTPGKGMPVNGGMTFQDQYSPTGEYALWMHNAILLPLIAAICVVVLALLLWVVARYNRRTNKVPSKTSHNTVIEVIWTLVPVLILVGIAIPSIDLLAKQYQSPPEDAVTVKVTGYQWYWGYTYPDNGGFEVISNMLSPEDALTRGEPSQLAVDNRMVVPAGEWLRIQTTGADVIHSFAVPSLWFKLDAVPGRLNERRMFIKEPGVYYGQCSELCGARHGYMPIAVEALPRPQWEAWVLSQGGELAGAAQPPSLPAVQQPESSRPGQPGAGPQPAEATPVLKPTDEPNTTDAI